MAVLSAFAVCAQSESDFKAQYERQVKAMGPSGMGVEYILKKWEAAFPESPDVHEAKFNYYFDKSRTEEMVGKTQMRFMGAEPVLFLTDSLVGKSITSGSPSMMTNSSVPAYRLWRRR